MTISGTVQLSGRVRYAAPVPNVDSSMNPTWLSDVVENMACSGRTEQEYTLAADGDVVVSFGGLVSASWVSVKVMPNVGIPPTPGFPNGVPAAQNPLVVRLTSALGVASFSVDPFLTLVSMNAPYTAMSIARAPGVQTTVRIQLFAFGS